MPQGKNTEKTTQIVTVLTIAMEEIGLPWGGQKRF